MKTGLLPTISSSKPPKRLLRPKTSISACGAQMKQPTFLQTIVSLSAISAKVTPSLFMVPLSLLPITIPKWRDAPSGSVPTPTIQVVNTLLFSYLSFVPTGPLSSGVGVQLPNFKEFIEQAYRAVTFAARPGVAAWRFPPHSLATNTLRLLLSLFATPGILIEGFGAGTSFSAVALFVNYSAPILSSMNVISSSIRTSLRKSALTRKRVHPITDHSSRPSSRSMASSLSSTYTIDVPRGP